VHYRFSGFESQPDFVSFNDDQTNAMIGSDENLLFVHTKKQEGDLSLSKKYNIEDVKSVIFEGSCFYILANKMN